MSGRIDKYSRSVVVRSEAYNLIRIVEHIDPETILIPRLLQYFNDIGFASKYANFGNIRVGGVHPFATLLFQEITSGKLDFNVFPSVTIADTTDNSAYQTLSSAMTQAMWGSADVALVEGHVAEGVLITSDNNIVRLKAATAGGKKILAIVSTERSIHTVDFNIWTDNKRITSILYDLVRHFAVQSIEVLHLKGLDFENELSGRRSGDINVDFGKMLYGANIGMKVAITTESVLIDLAISEMKTFDVHDTHTNFQP
jgi:hypothetical protein